MEGSVYENVVKRQRESPKYETLFQVGEGTYGFVFKATMRVPQQPSRKVAIKQFKPSKEGEGISLTAYREVMASSLVFF